MEQNHNMLRGISENGGIVFYGVDSTVLFCKNQIRSVLLKPDIMISKDDMHGRIIRNLL